MKSRPVLGAVLGASMAFASACTDSNGTHPLPDGGAALTPVVSPVRFVVRHTDYSSSAFSLLDAQGEIVADGYVHSGSMVPGLTALLSGDTDVPNLGEPGVLSILDRYGVDVLTRIELATGQVLGQLRTQGTSTSGFSGNPQDVAYASSTSAWVSRYGNNTLPGAAADIAGSDLLEIDPATMTRTGTTIPLTSFEQSIMVMGSSGTVTVTARARPRRIVQVGGYLAVGLDLISDGYEGAAPGKLAIVDRTTRAVTSHDLAPLTNCGGVQPVPGEPNQVAVVCQGWSDRTVESGLVIVSIDPTSGAATEVTHYLSSDHPTEDYAFDEVRVLGDGTFLGIHVGGYAPTDPPDTLVRVTLADGSRSTLLTAAHPSDFFTSMAFDPTTGLVLLPDASGGIRRLTRASDGTITEGTRVTPSGHGLPAVAASLFP